MAEILIAGQGLLGQPLARQLVDRGHTVTGLRRRAGETSGPIKTVQADLNADAELAGLPEAPALLVIILSPSERGEDAYRRTYIQAPAKLLAHYDKAGMEVPALFVSSTSVYGQNNGEWVDEDSVTEPADYRGRTLLQAEQQVLDADTQSTVVRYSGIYTADSRYLLDRVRQSPDIQREPPVYTNRIHRHDCIGILHFLIERMLSGQPLERIYIGSDDDPATQWDVMTFLASQLGVAPPRATNGGADTPQNKRCKNRRLREAGYDFIYPSFRQGYAGVE